MSSELTKQSAWIDVKDRLPDENEQVFIILPAIFTDGLWLASLEPYAWAQDPRVVPCDCYEDGHCNGTKERDACQCGGQIAVCDFYPEKAHFTL